LVVKLIIRLSGQNLVNPSLVLIGERTDRQLVALPRSPELLQTIIRSDKYVVDNLFDMIRRYASTDNADHMALVSADKVGISVSFSSSDTPEQIPILWCTLKNR
jgi:hypothetical protein